MELLNLENTKFESITYGQLYNEDVLQVIKDFLEEDPGREYSLVIGTDSHETNGSTLKNRTINLVTAVLVHRKGFGGKYFWTRKHISNIHSLREKIYAETLVSLDFAASFVPQLKRKLNGEAPNYNLEIHIDVGEHGDS